MTEVMPFSEAKSHLSDLADRVEHEHDRILVTRNGRPSFVLLSPDDLESLEETLEILRDQDTVVSLRRSMEDLAAGRTTPLRPSGEA
jgi:prevent-host-death family protein